MTATRTKPWRGPLAAIAVALAVASCGVLPGTGEPPQIFVLTAKSSFAPDLPRVDWQLTIDLPVAEQARVRHGLLRRRRCESAVEPGVLPAARIGDVLRQFKVLHLRGELRGKARGVEVRDGADSAGAGQLGVEHGLDAVAHRRDCAHARDDDSALHVLPSRTRGSANRG